MEQNTEIFQLPNSEYIMAESRGLWVVRRHQTKTILKGTHYLWPDLKWRIFAIMKWDDFALGKHAYYKTKEEAEEAFEKWKKTQNSLQAFKQSKEKEKAHGNRPDVKKRKPGSKKLPGKRENRKDPSLLLPATQKEEVQETLETGETRDQELRHLPPEEKV